MRKRSIVAAFSLALVNCGAEAGPRGFIIPHGGGPVWLDGENGVPPVYLDTRLKMHKQALEQLAKNLAQGAQVGSSVCAIKQVTSNSEDPSENPRYFTYLEESFRLAGLEPNRFRSYEFTERFESTAGNPEREEAIRTLTRDCGLVYLPSGDQTVMRDLWKDTPVHAALESIIQRGGGLMGNSAGAAILGSLVFFPGANDITTTRGILELNRRNLDSENRLVLERGLFTRKLVNFPRLYVETHADVRERTARAAAFLAAWENDKESAEEPAIAVVLDTDAGVLVSWDDTLSAWVGETSGGRSAEFLFPTSQSQKGWPQGSLPYYTHLKSHLMFDGGKVILSGPRKGEVIAHSGIGKVTEGIGPHPCTSLPERRIHGDSPQEAWDNSALHYTGVLPTGEITKPDWFEYDSSNPDVTSPNLFRIGNLRVEAAQGCGYWQPYAFHTDYGHNRDRLPMARYALGLGLSDFSVAIPMDMFVEPASRSSSSHARTGQVAGEMEIHGLAEGGSSKYYDSSVFVHDVRHAQRRGVSDYVYKVFDANAPLQTGMWEDARVHLLPPRASYDVNTGTVTLPSSFR